MSELEKALIKQSEAISALTETMQEYIASNQNDSTGDAMNKDDMLEVMTKASETFAQTLAQQLANVQQQPVVVQQPVAQSPVATEKKEPEAVSATVYTRELIREKGREYTRETHSLLFRVVDYLEDNRDAVKLSDRKLSAQYEKDTGESASRTWCNLAKKVYKDAV